MDERIVVEAEELLESVTGFRSPSSNRAQLERSLERLARSAGREPEDYVAALGSDSAQLQRLINTTLIGETYFFREAPQFRALRDIVLPQLATAKGRIVAWSASCSTGEEAVSLAAVISEFLRGRPGTSHVVHASDINDEALERLRGGVYPRSALRRDGSEFHDAFLARHVTVADAQSIAISPTTLAAIEPHHLNIFRDRLDVIPENLDIAFFRNTLLYSSDKNREAMIDRITRKLRPGGVLFFAMSELPFVKHPLLRLQDSQPVRYFARSNSAEKPREVARDIARVTKTFRESQKGEKTLPPGGDRQAALSASAPSADLASVLGLLNRSSIDYRPLKEKGEGPEGSQEPAREIAILVEQVFAAIANGKSDEAKLSLSRLTRSSIPEVECLVRYCHGWYHYMRGRPDLAEPEMARALEANAVFWPARFYLATIKARRSERGASREFALCAASIDQLHGDDRRSFDFLLEGFDIGYFQRMCIRWIERLDTERTR